MCEMKVQIDIFVMGGCPGAMECHEQLCGNMYIDTSINMIFIHIYFTNVHIHHFAVSALAC